MFITINGHLGSGKSTICCLLAEQFADAGIDVMIIVNKCDLDEMLADRIRKEYFDAGFTDRRSLLGTI